jgi:cation transport ATPase
MKDNEEYEERQKLEKIRREKEERERKKKELERLEKERKEKEQKEKKEKEEKERKENQKREEKKRNEEEEMLDGKISMLGESLSKNSSLILYSISPVWQKSYGLFIKELTFFMYFSMYYLIIRNNWRRFSL